jgi:hypothetical protein
MNSRKPLLLKLNLAVLSAAALLSVYLSCTPLAHRCEERAVLRWLGENGEVSDLRFDHDDGELIRLVESPGTRSGPRALVFALRQDRPDVRLHLMRAVWGDGAGVERDALFLLAAGDVEGRWSNLWGSGWRLALAASFRESWTFTAPYNSHLPSVIWSALMSAPTATSASARPILPRQTWGPAPRRLALPALVGPSATCTLTMRWRSRAEGGRVPGSLLWINRGAGFGHTGRGDSPCLVLTKRVAGAVGAVSLAASSPAALAVR